MQFETDYQLSQKMIDVDVDEQQDAFMSMFFANIHQCLLKQWECFVVEQSSKFR